MNGSTGIGRLQKKCQPEFLAMNRKCGGATTIESAEAWEPSFG